MPTIETNGFETYYERHGAGPALVLSHGSSWDCRSWMPQVRGLSTDYEVIVYDVRGHGRSESPGQKLDALSVLADDLHALVEALELDEPIVGGCSMGGRIAYQYAARYPNALAGLITLEAPVSEEGLSRKMRVLYRAMQGASKLVGPQRVLDVLVTVLSVLNGDEYGDQRVAGLGMTKAEYVESAREAMDAAEQLEWGIPDPRPGDLSAIQVPTLVLTGAESADRWASAAETLADRIPEARRESIPDAGHGAHMDNPVEFNRTVRLFLKGLETTDTEH